MRIQRLFTVSILIAAACIIMGAANARSENELAKKFAAAYQSSNGPLMTSIVRDNKPGVPDAVNAITGEAGALWQADEREARFDMAEMMARLYADYSGDTSLIVAVKRRAFDARLSKPERPAPVGGAYVVETPRPAPGVKNVFQPNNIIVRKGSTVRWVNKDNTAHIFASMPVIGEGGISSPPVEPGDAYERKFDKPGEYFYICFIHKSMYGKITVEE
ncbi:MAG: cupredoxin domain-containing protein [Deltaproteobacteria bacterium]|nr:cupredoxin domain-containing protein [Deltaproteobacteria bacterium]